MSGYQYMTRDQHIPEAHHRLRPQGVGSPVAALQEAPSNTVIATAGELQEKLNKLNSYVGMLKNILDDHNISYPPAP
ncbi:hypothetical protein QQ045_009739 [Rhodiola kirilowii]